ncbi:MAG: hypothetical protein JXB25_05070 [Deltaproteobacteria bacterium]|nr:hypothetical protein [Deltaproteobacteria bacterium]
MKRRSLVLIPFLVLLVPALAAGQEFGELLDPTERQAMMETLSFALEQNRDGEESSWTNPETGHSGAVIPMNRYTSPDGLLCRDYSAVILIDDEEERRHGTACRNRSGIWLIAAEGADPPSYSGSSAAFVTVYRDPYLTWYPWVYYAPFHYPHRLFFSFVFSRPGGHFHRFSFHDGHRYVGKRPLHLKKRRTAPRLHAPAPGSPPPPPHGRKLGGPSSLSPRHDGIRMKKPGSDRPDRRGAPALRGSSPPPRIENKSGVPVVIPKPGAIRKHRQGQELAPRPKVAEKRPARPAYKPAPGAEKPPRAKRGTAEAPRPAQEPLPSSPPRNMNGDKSRKSAGPRSPAGIFRSR